MEDVEMRNSNLMVNTNCIQCGNCLGCGFDFIKCATDGSITVKPGTVLMESSTEYKTLIEICPVGAFELEKGQNQADILNGMIEQLRNHIGINVPTIKDICFNKEEYAISLPSSSGEYQYEYNSDSAAESAALREFERAMYDRIDSIILRVITDYRVKKISPYYTTTIEEGSVYAICNQEVGEILTGIKSILGDKLPADFSIVEIFPNNDTTWKMLNKGELVSDELVSTVKGEFDYSSSRYDCYWDTDDREVACGTDWRGNTKYKDRYCYKNLRSAFQELANDLLSACGWASDSIENHALDGVKWLVEQYNKELKSVIANKIKQIESVM